ncbi:TPA: DUF551 domain-containing protein [Enterobacter kobei]
MSTITKEQLRERARQKVKSLELAVTQTAFADSRAELEEELELARIALASLEAEAVAWMWEYRDKNHVTNDPARAKFVAQDGDVSVQPLYTAPPAPVSVPAGYRLQPISEYDAMCAAMLQSFGNSERLDSPATPDGWVACSERMPIENDIVLVVDDGYFVCEAQYREGDFFSAVRGKGEFFETTCRDVELWMPLPAAPQQEA